MPVFLVNSYNIHNLEIFKEYPSKVAPLLLKYGARVLAMEINPTTLEGTPKTMNAILEFPSEEAVKAMYADPDYQAIIYLRHNSTSDCTMVILNQFARSSETT